MSPSEYEDRYNAVFALVKSEFTTFRRLRDGTIIAAINEDQLVFKFCDDEFLLGHGITSGCILYDKHDPKWSRVVLFPISSQLLKPDDVTKFVYGFVKEWKKLISGAR